MVNDTDDKLTISIMGNYTIEYIAKKLEEKLNIESINNNVYIPGFSQYNQEILDASSQLYKISPDIVFLLLQGEQLFKHVYEIEFLEKEESFKYAELNKIFEDIRTLLDTLLNSLDSTIIMNNFVVPFYSPLGILDNKVKLGLKEFISTLNHKLEEYSYNNRKLFIFDYNSLFAYHGFKESFDYKMYYLAKVHEKKNFIEVLCDYYLAYIHSLMGLNKKCLILDLDNTLWGGIVNEDGIEGIKLDIDGAGKCFWDFQNAIHDLYKNGVILAICSKNNYEDAINVIENHPYMVLRREHFASIQINWDEKYRNIKKISEELNIGLDSIVFLDDSLYERDQVRNALPMVSVPDLPKDTARYNEMLRELKFFINMNITEEDKARNEMYASNIKRNNESGKFENVEDYLKSLEMELIIEEANTFNLPRIHQLINKTNQFNMTTKRYGMEEIVSMMNRNDFDIYCFNLKDKFGDNGIIGVVILKYETETCFLDTFLLSCRVLGRKVETVILKFIVEKCLVRNVNKIEAFFYQTQKNKNLRYTYKEHGFKIKEENPEFISYYLDDLKIETTKIKLIKALFRNN